MKPKPNPFSALVALALFGSHAAAAPLHWDGTDSTSDADGGSGTWDAGLTANWDDAATLGNSLVWPSSSGGNDDAVFAGSAGTVTIASTVTANDLTFTTSGYEITGGILALDGSAPTVTTDANALISSQITGSAGLIKAGAATLTLAGANTYTGTTTISGGTLALTGGNNRLATTGSLTFAANGTLDLGGNSQTLANLSILTASGNTKGILTNGSLTLNGAGALTITPSVTTGGRIAEIDASGLSSLTISKSGQALTVGGLAGATSPGNSAILRLSAVSNSITASTINIGTTGGANASGIINKGELELGASNTIHADTWNIGNTRDGGIVRFQTGLVNPTVTLRAQDGSSRVTKITIGQNAAGSTAVGTSSMELANGSVDLLVTDLVLSRGGSASPNKPAVNGYFSMGGGTVDATNIWVSKNESGGLNTTNTAHFYQLGGNVKVSTLTLADTTSVSTTNIPTFNSQYTLTSGVLSAANIKAGAGVFTTSTIRRINFNGGTITHYDSATNLTINGVTGTGGTIGIVLGTDGSPTIQADAGRTVTLGAFTAISGAGTLTKTGAGTLAANGTGTYTGATSIQGGSVVLGGNDRLSTVTDLTLSNSAGVLLNLNSFNQTLGSLAGGGTNGGNVSLGTGILKVGNANTTTFAGSISGTGSFVKVGTGTLTLSGSTTASLTGLNASGGTLRLGTGQNLTITGSASTGAPDGTTGFIVSRGATFELNGGTITATGGSYVFTAGNTGGGTSNFIQNSGTFDAGAKEVLNAYGAAGNFTLNGGTFTAGEFRISQSAAGSVTLNGGVLTVTNLKSANNTEIINFNGGTLRAKADNANFITTGVDLATVRAGGAVIDTNGFNITIPKDLTEDGGSPGGGLQKTGSGTLILTAANTYTGQTTLNGGTLLANNSTGSATGSGAVVVNAGTLGGSGAIAGNVTIQSAGFLSPGASIESLATGAVTLNTGSTFVYEMDTTAANGDLLDANGDLQINGTVTLNLVDLGTNLALAGGTKFTLISYFGSWDGDVFSGFADDSTFNLFNNQWRINYDDTPAGSANGGAYANAVTLTVVPEPAAPLLAGSACLVLLSRRRKPAGASRR